MFPRNPFVPFVALFALTLPALAQKGESTRQDPTSEAAEAVEFTLENIFPDKKQPLFGPRASSAAFSHDGRHAAYLHRGYRERRHGSDLWLVDVARSKQRRLTSALTLSEFQASARKVVDDRVRKAKAAQKKAAQKKVEDKQSGKKKTGKKKSGKDGTGGDARQREEARQQERKKFGNVVDAKDANAEKAPRYGGVSSFEWSPVADELLFTSAGDIYRFVVGADAPERLTQTKARERDVQYLPDGSGYTYLLDGALMQVRFGSHLIVQLDPKLPSGESMSSYRISPDGKKLVFMAGKGASWRGSSRRVNIARYRERFMEVREVPRTVSDDKLPERETFVYLHELGDDLSERNKPRRVWTHKHTGPRDILRVPQWAPDSSRVTFATFEQKSSQVLLLQAHVDPASPVAKDGKGKDAKNGEMPSAGADGKGKVAKESGADKPYVEARADVVYRFLHDGGPNTPGMMQPRYSADSRHIVFLSEQTGFRHVHVLDPLYQSQRPLTHGRYEVYPFDMDKAHRRLHVLATKEHPTRQDVYTLDLESGEMVRINRAAGVYSGAAISPDGRAALATRSTYGSLRELALITHGGRHEVLTESHPKRTAKLTEAAPEFFTYENRHGHEIHGYLFKPEGWSKDDKRPLLLYVYGGPLGTRKQVVDGSYQSAGYFFGQYMARQHGWVTCTIDPRGMSGYGGVFEKANFEQVGKPQVEDLTDGVKHLVAEFGVDSKKVAMHGWSFGGFQTQMCMYSEPDVFQVGIAGAGPTEWENYNAWYSTGTIGKSREGKTDLGKYSLLPLAKNLKGKLLLVHGMEDSNVLYQDTVRVYRELLKADKETLVELFLDPTGGHGLGGDVTTVRRFRKYEEFLVRNLGGLPADKSTN
ncbi:MAG: prolyl oligopeptidase family serine peptidase [bacterium]|nr:prolyl oligopeptidase family serine peptidase [bacterium]